MSVRILNSVPLPPWSVKEDQRGSFILENASLESVMSLSPGNLAGAFPAWDLGTQVQNFRKSNRKPSVSQKMCIINSAALPLTLHSVDWFGKADSRHYLMETPLLHYFPKLNKTSRVSSDSSQSLTNEQHPRPNEWGTNEELIPGEWDRYRIGTRF